MTNKNHASELRPFNNQEKSLAILIAASVQSLISTLDEMKHTNMYRNRLKQIGNQFLAELEKHAKQSVWDGPSKGTDIDAVFDQMEDIVRLHKNFMMIALALGEVHQAQHPLFWLEMQKQFKRFDMPLRIDHTGDLQFLNDKILEPA